MAMFDLWTDDEIRAAVKSLEQAIAEGVSSCSYPGGGTLQYVPQAQMERTLRSLYAALAARDPDNPRKPPRRLIVSTPSKGL